MIKIENLTKTYSGDQVLNISSLGISKGSCFGLVGNNGAGKTTLFSLLLDLIEPTSGEILNQGIEVSKDESWKEKTSAFIDSTFIISYLTPEEYFEFIAELRGVNKEALKSWLEKFSDFFKDEVLSQKKYIRDLSKGNQKKVGIASSLIGSPELVILDEPFSNLDPSSQILLKKLIQNDTVMISGAGGSIGSELTRQVLKFKPKIILCIDISEAALYQLEQSIIGTSKTKILFIVADIKNEKRIKDLFNRYIPSLVLHAAAYKHVPLMETENVSEVLINNAKGTFIIANTIWNKKHQIIHGDFFYNFENIIHGMNT